MSVGSRILRNAGNLTAARGLTSVITLATTVYLARVLEPAGYGVLNWGLAFLAYFTIAADLGLGVYAVREVSRDPRRARLLSGSVLFLRFTFAFFALCVYLGIVLTLGEGPQFTLVVGLLGLILLANAIELGWVYHGLERLGVVAVRNVVASLVTLVGALLLVRRPEHVVIAAAVFVAAAALPNFWLLFTYLREFGRPRFVVKGLLWRTMLAAALPIAASQFLYVFNTNLDQLMLGVLRTTTEVGWYAAAYRVLTAVLIPAQIAFLAFLPALSGALGDRDAMQKRGRDFALTLFAVGLPMGAAGIVLAPGLIGVFGAEYGAAAFTLGILMAHAGLVFVHAAYGNPLLAWDRQRLYLGALIVGATLNLGLNFFLIPRWGIEGAAFATLGSEAVVAAIVAVMHYRIVGTLYGHELLKTVAVVAFSVGGGALLGRALGLGFVPLAALLAVAYAGAAVATGLVDVRRLREAFRS